MAVNFSIHLPPIVDNIFHLERNSSVLHIFRIQKYFKAEKNVQNLKARKSATDEEQMIDFCQGPLRLLCAESQFSS